MKPEKNNKTMYIYKAKWGSIEAYGKTFDEAVRKIIDNPDFALFKGKKEEIDVHITVKGINGEVAEFSN